MRGAAAIAETFSARARAARLALLEGHAGAVWAPGGQPPMVFGFTMNGGQVADLELLADPGQLVRLHLVLPDN